MIVEAVDSCEGESVSCSIVATLCDLMNCSPPGFSVRRILQARILEWVGTSFSRDLLDPGLES